jgi:hypothetical protein
MDPLLYAREHDLDRQLARTQTILQDASHCDFQYKQVVEQ